MSRKKRRKPIPTKNSRNILKNIVAYSLIAVTLLSGVWLIISPTLEKQAALSQQRKLLASVGMITSESEISDRYSVSEPDIISPIATDFSITYIPDEAPESVSRPPVLPTSGLTAIGILEIDKINLKLPIVCGVSDEQLKIAAGLVPQTVGIGEIGNAVIAGHRSYTYGKDFNRLGEMKIGDMIGYTSADSESCLFEVFEITTIEPSDQIAFIQPKDEAIITFYTCTPIKTATHRLLVRARKI